MREKEAFPPPIHKTSVATKKATVELLQNICCQFMSVFLVQFSISTFLYCLMFLQQSLK